MAELDPELYSEEEKGRACKSADRWKLERIREAPSRRKEQERPQQAGSGRRLTEEKYRGCAHPYPRALSGGQFFRKLYGLRI